MGEDYGRPFLAVTVSAPNGNAQYWGHTTSDMQSSVAVSNGAITGTLKPVTSGALPDVWGEGYFLALKFATSDTTITSIKVGLDPSVSSGLVELDEDMDGVFKITDKDTQKLVVVKSDGQREIREEYDLSGLTLQE